MRVALMNDGNCDSGIEFVERFPMSASASERNGSTERLILSRAAFDSMRSMHDGLGAIANVDAERWRRMLRKTRDGSCMT